MADLATAGAWQTGRSSTGGLVDALVALQHLTDQCRWTLSMTLVVTTGRCFSRHHGPRFT